MTEQKKHRALSWKPSDLVQRMAAQYVRPSYAVGPDTIDIGLGDPDFATPAYISEAHRRAVLAGYTHYADGAGDPDLRAAIAQRLTKRSGREWTGNQVQITHGATAGIAAAILATINPLDRVIIPQPAFGNYAEMTIAAGGVPVYVGLREDLHLDLDAIRTAAPGARMLVVCSPNNPSGVVYSRAEFDAIAEIAEEYDLIVLSDETYHGIVFNGVDFVSALDLPQLAERLIYCQSFAKTYAMTGWRIGYLAGPAPIISAVSRAHRGFTGGINAAVQRAALAAITVESDEPAAMVREYQARRDMFVEALAGVPRITATPCDGSFYMFPRIEAGLTSDKLTELLFHYGVLVRSGTDYGPGGEGYVRVALTTSRERLMEAASRMVAALMSVPTGRAASGA